MGRPSKYSEALADKIAEAVSQSECGLERLCDETDEFPSGRTAWQWMAERPEFSQKITRAKERQAEKILYKGLKRLEDCDSSEGNAEVSLARAEADFRIKMVAKTAPRTMGDRKKYEHGGDPDGVPISSASTSVKFDASTLSEEEREQARKLVHAAMQRGAGQ